MSQPVNHVDISLHASRSLAWLLGAVHAAAIAAILSMPLAWWLRLAGCAILLASGIGLVIRQALLKAPDSIIRLRLAQDGSCELRTRDQRVINGMLQPAWFASPLMVVLRVASPGRRLAQGITVLPDAADADSQRRLRIFLRFAIGSSVGNQ